MLAVRFTLHCTIPGAGRWGYRLPGQGGWSDELRPGKGFISCEVQLSLSTEWPFCVGGAGWKAGHSFPMGGGEVVGGDEDPG